MGVAQHSGAPDDVGRPAQVVRGRRQRPRSRAEGIVGKVEGRASWGERDGTGTDSFAALWHPRYDEELAILQTTAKLREILCTVAWREQHKMLLHEVARIARDAIVCEESVEGVGVVLVLGMVARSILRPDVVLAARSWHSSPEASKVLDFVDGRPRLRRAPAFAEAFAMAKRADLEERRRRTGDLR